MTRVKRGVAANKRRKGVLKLAKGYMWGRSSKYHLAKDAVLHALSSAFNDRRKKKGHIRTEWAISINAASRERGTTYSKLISGLKKANIEIDRKVLSDFAVSAPKIFDKIAELAK